MFVMCAWCEREGKPALLAEKAPLDNYATTHGICVDHSSAILAKLTGPLDLTRSA